MTSISTSGRPQCILVTGAGGFVGRWLLRALSSRVGGRCRIVATTLRNSEFDTCVEQQCLNILDRDQVDFVLSETRPSCVIHLAAVTDVISAKDSPRSAWAVNVDGTINLTEAILKHVPESRFIFISSSEVYGESFERNKHPLNEDALLAPINHYGVSKAAADILVGQLAHEGLKSVRFRPFNHTGPGQTPRFAIPAFAMQIARIEKGLQEPILQVGNLNVSRSFLDVRDVVSAYALAAVNGENIPSGQIINLGSDVSYTMAEVVSSLVGKARVKISVKAQPQLRRSSETWIKIGDFSRAKALLNWAPQIPWDDTLNDILDEYRHVVNK